MKKAGEDLFLLIKSLTPTEKRYFRLFAGRHTIGEQNNYLALFDAIDAQEKYDEARLKQSLSGAAFVRYLPVAKRYLHQQIAEALHQYHLVNSVAEQVKKALHIVAIFLEKNLIGQAEKILAKAGKKIEAYELFQLAPELKSLERQLMERRFYQNTSPEDLEAWRQSYHHHLNRLHAEAAYAHHSSTIARLHYRKISTAESSSAPAGPAASPTEQFSAENAPSQRSRLDWLRAQATLQFMTGHPQKAYDYNQATLRLFEEHPHLLELHPRRYLSVLNNFLIDNQQLRKYDILEEGLQKLKALPQRKDFSRIPHLEARVFEWSTILELNTLVTRRQFGDALGLLPGIGQALQKHGAKLAFHYRLTIYYLIALVYYENRRLEVTLTWLNHLLQQPPKNVVEELFRFARLLNILTHYQLGNADLVDHLLVAFRRQYTAGAGLFESEKYLLHFLKKRMAAVGRLEIQALQKEYAAKMTLLREQESEQRVFNYLALDRRVV